MKKKARGLGAMVVMLVMFTGCPQFLAPWYADPAKSRLEITVDRTGLAWADEIRTEVGPMLEPVRGEAFDRGLSVGRSLEHESALRYALGREID